VHQASQGTKYNIRAHDSVIGATSREVRDKILKQIPLDPRPAAAKTIHRSQGDTETRVVVNFETKRAIPHIHYVGLSRVTAIDGLHITNLCEDKISVSPAAEKQMLR